MPRVLFVFILFLASLAYSQEGIWEDSLPLGSLISQEDLDSELANYCPLTGCTFTGDITFADNIAAIFGSGSDWDLSYDEADNDQLVLHTPNDGSTSVNDSMLLFLVDSDTPLGASLTADQLVFGIGKGQPGAPGVDFNYIFAVQDDGDAQVGGDLTVTGDLTFIGSLYVPHDFSFGGGFRGATQSTFAAGSSPSITLSADRVGWFFTTDATSGPYTIDDFTVDVGTPSAAQVIMVKTGAEDVTYNCTTGNLNCGPVDFTTGADDITQWIVHRTTPSYEWQLIAYEDNSSGAAKAATASTNEYTATQIFSAPVSVGSVNTFGNPDTTPDVSGSSNWATNAVAQTIEDFDNGVEGQIIYVTSKSATEYDCTGSGLSCDADFTTAVGDETEWRYDGADWILVKSHDSSGVSTNWADLNANAFNGQQCSSLTEGGACDNDWIITPSGQATFVQYVATNAIRLPTVGGNAWLSYGTDIQPTFHYFDADGGDVFLDGEVRIEEKAAANSVAATWGTYWTKNTTPTEPWFTDDNDAPYQLAYLAEVCELAGCTMTGDIVFDAVQADFRDGSGNAATMGYELLGAGSESVFYIRPHRDQNNFMFGRLAGLNITHAERNVSIGERSAQLLTSGVQNVFVGDFAGNDLQTGGRNTCVGYGACDGIEGSYNVGIGQGALAGSGTFNYATAVGRNAGSSLTTGSKNLFFGYQAGPLIDEGIENVVIGQNSGNTIDVGDQNIAIGVDSLTQVTDHNRNVALGVKALRYQAGAENIGLGFQAGAGTSSTSAGDGNIFIGDSAGYSSQGEGNIFIGHEAARDHTTENDMLIIDNRDQGSKAATETDAIIVGQMHATPSSQTLKFNAVVTDTYDAIHKADSYWEDDGSGIAFGSMYTNATIAVTIAASSTPTEIGDTWTAGEVNLTSFGASHYITVTKAGRYKVDWSLSIAQNTPSASIQCEQGIMVNGSAQSPGVAHRTIANSSDVGASAGTAILDLAASDQISLYVENQTNTTNIDVEHGNVTVTMVGGT
jgi:hypothetical protein